jgi:serine/threonine protein kinase
MANSDGNARVAPGIGIGAEVGHYRLERVLGRGGMGILYRARDLRLERVVALKLIQPQFAADHEFRVRFRKESHAAAAIEHPHVVPVYEAGVTDDLLFIAMRLIVGTDLRQLIEAGGRLDVRRAVEVVSQMASALDAAHERGLIHRDVKPANILVTPNGDAVHTYLTDFGLSKPVEGSDQVTGSGVFVGTVDYAAPEQLRGERVDPQADVYSLACVFFHAVAGQVPFPRDTYVAKLFAHVHEPPPRLPPHVEAAAALDEVLHGALSKRPEVRPRTAGDLATALRGAVEAPQRRPSPPRARKLVVSLDDDEGPSPRRPARPPAARAASARARPHVVPVPPVRNPPRAPAAATPPRASPLPPGAARRRRVGARLAGAMLVATALVGGGLLSRSLSSEEPSPAANPAAAEIVGELASPPDGARARPVQPANVEVVDPGAEQAIRAYVDAARTGDPDTFCERQSRQRVRRRYGSLAGCVGAGEVVEPIAGVPRGRDLRIVFDAFERRYAKAQVVAPEGGSSNYELTDERGERGWAIDTIDGR